MKALFYTVFAMCGGLLIVIAFTVCIRSQSATHTSRVAKHNIYQHFNGVEICVIKCEIVKKSLVNEKSE